VGFLLNLPGLGCHPNPILHAIGNDTRRQIYRPVDACSLAVASQRRRLLVSMLAATATTASCWARTAPGERVVAGSKGTSRLASQRTPAGASMADMSANGTGTGGSLARPRITARTSTRGSKVCGHVDATLLDRPWARDSRRLCSIDGPHGIGHAVPFSSPSTVTRNALECHYCRDGGQCSRTRS